MSLHNTDGLTIEAATAAESLPDPTTVSGRTHILANTSLATTTWSSTGATPFTENGINVVTITVLAGQAKRVQSDGVRWLVKAVSVAGRHIYAATGVTDAGGNVTFTYPTPFTATPVVNGQVGPSGDTALVEARLTASSTTACTFNVRRSPSVVVLGISVLQVPANAPGVTVQMIATDQGETF